MRVFFPALWGLAVLLLGASPAAAELELQKVQWQFARPGKGGPDRFQNISVAALSGAKLGGRLKANVTLLNRGPKAVEGILLRYSAAAKIAAADGGEAEWAVPFLLEEKRVPKVGPNQRKEVPLELTISLNLYLKRVNRVGYRVRELKVQIMLEPRRGETFPPRVIEGDLAAPPDSGT